MKILSAEQIRAGDAYTIKHEPISSIDLMERAAERCYQWIYDRAPQLFPPELDEREYRFKVFCGVGNNGGDGLVIARMLSRSGYEVEVYMVMFSDKLSPDCKTNLERLGKRKVAVERITKTSDIPEIESSSVVIDALFGTGLSRKVDGVAADVVQRINESKAAVISVDMPSGLFDEDNSGNDPNAIVRAKYTLTFQFLKLAFLYGENADYVGQCEVIDIGMHRDFIEKVESDFRFITPEMVKSRLQVRQKFSHKGTFGHVAVVAGSRGKYGAAIMSSRAALRSGAGLVTAHLPVNGTPIMQTAAPEVMVDENRGTDLLTADFDPSPYSAIGVGPGMGTNKDTQTFFKKLLDAAKVPLVLDADALNILAENSKWCEKLPENTVLTPHPGEFRRLVGDFESDHQKLQMQVEWAKKNKVYLLLKGAHSSLATPGGEVFFNRTGNPGMATAGSGDVLTGILTGLLAQGYSSTDAVIIGVFLHGRAGDIAAETSGQEALIATDIIDHLGKAFLSFNLPEN